MPDQDEVTVFGLLVLFVRGLLLGAFFVGDRPSFLRREDRGGRPVSVQEEGSDERQEAFAAESIGVFAYNNLSPEVGVLMVMVFSLLRLTDGEAPLLLRFERFQGVECGILRVRRVVVGGGPVGSLARVFEYDGFARHNLHRARLESLVRHAYDDTIGWLSWANPGSA